MKKTTQKLIALLALAGAFSLAGCTERVSRVDEKTDTSEFSGISYKDFAEVAQKMLQDLLASGKLDRKDGKPWLIQVGSIKNDTRNTEISTSQLMTKIRKDLTNSGKAAFITEAGGLQPELAIHGKIFQRNSRLDKNTIQVEYYFELTLTEIKTRIEFWQNEVSFVKRGDKVEVLRGF